MPAGRFDEGHYKCRVTGQGFARLESGKKSPYFFLNVIPFAARDHNDPEKWWDLSSEEEVTVKMFMSGKGPNRVAAILKNLGWEDANGEQSPWRQLEPGGEMSFLAVELELVNTHNDQGYDQFDFPGAMGSSAAHDPSVARELESMFGKAAPKSRATVPGATARKPARAATNGDDIPF